MADEDRRSTRRANQSLAQLQRDSALSRVGRTRRVMIGGAAALTAGFAALTSAIAPGRSLGAKQVQPPARGQTRQPPATATRMPPPAGASDLGLQAPSQAPQAPAQQQQAPPQSPQPPQAAPADQAPAPAPAPADTQQAPSGGPVVSGGS